MGGDAEEKKPSKDCSAEQEAFNVAEAAVAVIDNKLFVAETDLANLETAYSTCNTVVSCFSLLQQILQKRAEIVFLRIALRNATQRLAQARAALEICLAEKNAQGSSLVTGALRALMSAATTALSSQSSGSFTFCGVTSVDPNAKLGVSGAGQEQYVRVTAPLSYTILFENLPTAGAAASKVIVSDPLDSNLDLSTLSLSSLRFGSTDIELPPGISSYTTPIDLTSTQNLFVNLTAQLVGRTLVVTFTSIDPTTGQPPTDLRGFLPPDTNPPNGEGSVTFTVMPKQGLFTGIQISNAATIVFDTNPAINTPIWLNTIDNSNPVSKVSSLPSNQASYNFNVQWSGTDDGSGIRDFTIYVSDNGGPFSAWLTQTTALQATYKGVGGHTYSFYSIALDLVGNLENLKTSAEATTQVIVDTTPPQIIPQVSGTLVNNGWYRSAVTVNWTVTDPESGIASSSGCAPTILTADTAGATLTCLATNGAGLSASVPVTIKIDTTPPVATASANPSTLWPPNGKMVNVTVSGTVTDATSGVNPNSANFAVVDKYGSVRPSGNVLLAANGTYSFTISLQASRLGTDQNGRTYTVTVTAQDNAGNQSSAATTVVVPHDQGPWRWPTLPTECGEQCRNEEFLRCIQGALRIPSLSFQYLRRPGRTAKLLCFHIAGELGEFAPHRLDHL